MGDEDPKIKNFTEGTGHSFIRTITVEEVDKFAQISGDTNPLHLVDSFAQARGFKGRVVHGALLISYISQMLGVFLPGNGCLWQNLKIQFQSPCYIGDTVEIKAMVDQVSTIVNVIVLTITVDNVNTRVNLMKAKAQVSFLGNP